MLQEAMMMMQKYYTISYDSKKYIWEKGRAILSHEPPARPRAFIMPRVTASTATERGHFQPAFLLDAIDCAPRQSALAF